MEDVVAELVDEQGDEDEVRATYAMYVSGVARKLREQGATSALPVLERVARESLLILRDSSVYVSADDLGEIQEWFPHLVPHIVAVLTGPSEEEAQAEAAEYVRARLEQPSGMDWIDAWM